MSVVIDGCLAELEEIEIAFLRECHLQEPKTPLPKFAKKRGLSQKALNEVRSRAESRLKESLAARGDEVVRETSYETKKTRSRKPVKRCGVFDREQAKKDGKKTMDVLWAIANKGKSGFERHEIRNPQLRSKPSSGRAGTPFTDVAARKAA